MLSLLQSTAGRFIAWVTQRVNHLVKAICRVLATLGHPRINEGNHRRFKGLKALVCGKNRHHAACGDLLSSTKTLPIEQLIDSIKSSRPGHAGHFSSQRPKLRELQES